MWKRDDCQVVLVHISKNYRLIRIGTARGFGRLKASYNNATWLNHGFPLMYMWADFVSPLFVTICYVSDVFVYKGDRQ